MAVAGIRGVEVSASSFKHFDVTYVARALGATIDLEAATRGCTQKRTSGDYTLSEFSRDGAPLGI
jgi:hypothetical protein